MLNYKDFISLLEKGLTAETRQKLIEMREEAFELREKNLDLVQRIKELERTQKLKESLEYNGSVYQFVEDDGSRFCQQCFDSTEKLIRLQAIQPGRLKPQWMCFKCHNTYTKL